MDTNLLSLLVAALVIVAAMGVTALAAKRTNRVAVVDVTWGLGFIAVVASTINVVGGFIITDRMLKMFKPREKRPSPAEERAAAAAAPAATDGAEAA